MLKNGYPSIYVYVLERLGCKEKAQRFKLDCKAQEDNNFGNYSSYVHGWWIPLLETMRQEGKLKQGKYPFSVYLFVGTKKLLMYSWYEYTYIGELDKQGNACGHGIALPRTDYNADQRYIKQLTYEGTFLNNHPHGICKYCSDSDKIKGAVTEQGLEQIEGEWHKGKCHGKYTHY